MEKLTKKTRKAIAQLAAIFPEKPLAESHRVQVSGHELLRQGLRKTSDGAAVLASGVYESYRTGAKRVNHASRMEAAYRLAGRRGVMQYGRSLLRAEYHADWDRTVTMIFDFEEKGIMTPLAPHPQEAAGSGAVNLKVAQP